MVKYYVHPERQKVHGNKKTRMGTILAPCTLGKFADIVLDGDPFGTYVFVDRIEFTGTYNTDHPLIRARDHYRTVPLGRQNRSNEGMATATKKISAKELRREAKALGVAGWEEMDADALKAAIKSANGNGSAKKSKKAKAATTEAPAKKSKKAAAPKTEAAEPAENGNPFRAGTNLFLITEELLKGGKRSKMVDRLTKKITLKPRTASDDFDERAELDRRILVTAQLLEKNHGFSKEKDGRGSDATIKVTAP